MLITRQTNAGPLSKRKALTLQRRTNIIITIIIIIVILTLTVLLIVQGSATAVSREIEASQRIEIQPEIEIHRTTGIFQGIGVVVSLAGEVSHVEEEEIIITSAKIPRIQEDFKREVEVHRAINIQR